MEVKLEAVLEGKRGVVGAKVLYETILVLRSSVSDEDVSKEMDKAKAIIARGGGRSSRLKIWGGKSLPMKCVKKREAFIF